MGCKASKPAIYPDKTLASNQKKKIEQKKWTPAEAPEIKLFSYDVNNNNSCAEVPFQCQ